jgi:hypothetical protein
MNYGNKSHNSKGKAQVHVVKVSETVFTAKVPSHTKNGEVFVGWGEITLKTVNPAGLKAAKAGLTLSDLIDLNRQKVTDVMNDLRRYVSYEQALADYNRDKIDLTRFTRICEGLAKRGDKKATKAIKALESVNLPT